MYDFFLCANETSLVISESAIFGGDGGAWTDNLGTDAVSDTTLGSGVGWGAKTVYFGVSFDGNMEI